MCINNPIKPTKKYDYGYKIVNKIGEDLYEPPYYCGNTKYQIGIQITCSDTINITKEVDKLFRKPVSQKLIKKLNKLSYSDFTKLLNTLDTITQIDYVKHYLVDNPDYSFIEDFYTWSKKHQYILMGYIESDIINASGFHVFTSKSTYKLEEDEIVIKVKVEDVLWESKDKKEIIAKTITPIKEL